MAKYIDKSVIVAEIRRIKTHEFYLHLKEDESAHRALDMVLESLDTLETKEVDLEKELERLDNILYDLDGVAIKGATSYLTVEDVKYIAKNFFELGLKTQKGE